MNNVLRRLRHALDHATRGINQGRIMSVDMNDLLELMRDWGRLDQLLRNLRPHVGSFGKQVTFSPEAGTPDTGNCYQVCVASVLGLQIQHVPHFYSNGTDNTAHSAAIAEFLRQKGYFVAYYTWDIVKAGTADGWLNLPDNNLVIISGMSPRGDFQHAVVGRLNDSGWEMIHDPHPSNAGIVGEPVGMEVIAYVPHSN